MLAEDTHPVGRFIQMLSTLFLYSFGLCTAQKHLGVAPKLYNCRETLLSLATMAPPR